MNYYLTIIVYHFRDHMEVEDTHHQVTTAWMAPSYKRKYRQVTSRMGGGTRIYEIFRDKEQQLKQSSVMTRKSSFLVETMIY